MFTFLFTVDPGLELAEGLRDGNVVNIDDKGERGAGAFCSEGLDFEAVASAATGRGFGIGSRDGAALGMCVWLSITCDMVGELLAAVGKEAL